MKKVKKLYKDWYNKIKQQHLTEKRNPQYTYVFNWTFKSSDSMKKIKPGDTFKTAKVLKVFLRANNIYLNEVGWNNRGKITCTNKIKSATFDVYIKDIPCSIMISKFFGVSIITNYHKHKKNNTLENCIAYNALNDIFVQDRQKHKELNIDYNNLTEEEIFQLSTVLDIDFYKTIKNIGTELYNTQNLNCNKLVAVLNKYK
ncbi:hypothetical protein RaK2_00321 [Klebsiella phage vB_KleM_RaK2]|uniref:Uncharacterized protein n=1 Tax=Klebsiella phage vB_KleM_RaK2 TaxID=1147094 RepID=H6X4C8_9CAUD|nr:hypothetical protein F403_gp214 [Klebsiella phage vB_KleM_RaK2]AFA44594.1 hypothetical protein RaK2_00321 [Klebsiella phage vB_KleM_RaK2]